MSQFIDEHCLKCGKQTKESLCESCERERSGLKTYKVSVSETVVGYYLIDATSEEQAEDIYYGMEVGEMSEIYDSDSEYVVGNVEEAEGDEQAYGKMTVEKENPLSS